MVNAICATLDELRPGGAPHARLITYVKDRPGHDRRYAMDIRKLSGELGWKPEHAFDSGLRQTIEWYLDHADWVEGVASGTYREWLDLNYGKR